MKLLVAYDGSEYAIEAVDDLLFAGLPEKGEAVVLSVTDDYYPLLSPGASGVVAEYVALESVESGDIAKPLEESRQSAEEGKQLIQELYPGWSVSAETNVGSAATAIIERAEQWKPDLVVIGSHGRTGLKRFLLGSVSMKVLSAAHCSVRLARKHETKSHPLKILVGYDGSEDSERILHILETRHFPKESVVKLVSTLEIFYTASMPYSAVAVEEALIENLNDREKMLTNKLQDARKRLQARFGTVETELVKGNPKHVLIDIATKWKADEIFVGARGLGKMERIFVGSVSTYVAGHAHCTVEVVRP
jgi:nucleotide-binding universal stress UspA family protein